VRRAALRTVGAEPQDLRNAAVESGRQELGLFRRQDPTPEFRTAMTLFTHLKIQHDEIAMYIRLVDEAVLLGQIEAARILTTIAKQAEAAAARTGRLIPELLVEMAGDTGSATEVTAARRH
jgi:hypothetical protein